tara:strand:+ start:95 stop:1054 length:960 start_codon:yes stop_codon:yes gene_type:complete
MPDCANGVGVHLYSDQYGDWRSVPGFDVNKVIVSSLGYHRMRIMGSMMRPAVMAAIGEKGYRQVSIDRKRKGVHQLVCLAFHGHGAVGDTVDHIDGNTSNNVASNLRWASKSLQVKNRKSWSNRAPAQTQETQDDLEGEQWKVANDRLKVSNMGRVQRLNKRSIGKRFTPYPSSTQTYAIVQSNKYVHHLVFSLFCRGLKSGETIDHINGKGTDNRASNLRGATKSLQSFNRSLKPTNNRTNTMKSPIKGRRVGAVAWERFDSCHDAARKLTELIGVLVDPGRISAVSRHGKGAKSTRGWEFRQDHAATPASCARDLAA